MPAQAEIEALPQPRRRPLRPAPRHPARHAGHRGHLRRAVGHLDSSRPTPATRSRARFVIMATGCLSVPMKPDVPGSRRSSGEVVQTSLLADARASTSPASASRVIGTGLVGGAVDPRDRRAGRAPLRVPAHADLHVAVVQRPARPGACRPRRSARYPRAAQAAAGDTRGRQSPRSPARSSCRVPKRARSWRRPTRSACAVLDEQGWGGRSRVDATCWIDLEANETAGELYRGDDPPHRGGPRQSPIASRRRTTPSAASGRSSTSTTSRRSTATT